MKTEELQALTVAALRELCVKHGLPDGGVKAELVERLQNHFAQDHHGGEKSDQGGDDGGQGDHAAVASEEAVHEPIKFGEGSMKYHYVPISGHEVAGVPAAGIMSTEIMQHYEDMVGVHLKRIDL